MKSVVLLSGGQDSSVCAMLERQVSDVTCLFVNYGQRHLVERESARAFCTKFGFDLVELDFPQYAGVSNSSDFASGESPVISNRNALLLTVGCSLAQKIGAESVTIGVCGSDQDLFADCRVDYLRVLNSLVFPLGEVKMPLVHLNKADVLQLGCRLGLEDWLKNGSHTCYNGSRKNNWWGVGCGECLSCQVVLKAVGGVS